MPHAQIGDIEIYFERAGSGRPLLFIGGTGGDLRQKPSVFDGPLAQQFDLVSYDQCGPGAPTSPIATTRCRRTPMMQLACSLTSAGNVHPWSVFRSAAWSRRSLRSGIRRGSIGWSWPAHRAAEPAARRTRFKSFRSYRPKRRSCARSKSETRDTTRVGGRRTPKLRRR